MDLEGKVVLITGAGKGVGRLLARLFADRGAYVAANDISPVNLDELVQAGNGRIRGYTEDIAKKVGLQAVIKQVEDDFGRLDILVNHASVQPHVSLLEMDEWDWHRVLDVNLGGAFLGIQSAGRIMRQNGSGVIINWLDLPASGRTWPAYAASMYGLVGLTMSASAELRSFGVLVHALGRGLSSFENVGASAPRDLNSAVLYLCNSTEGGWIVNLEDE